MARQFNSIQFNSSIFSQTSNYKDGKNKYNVRGDHTIAEANIMGVPLLKI